MTDQTRRRGLAAELRIRPFTLEVPESALADLRDRLARTRFPDEPPLPVWSTGTSREYLRELAAYLRESFDWGGQEVGINGFRQCTPRVRDMELHFVREPGRGAQP